jgi:hypothetical protein
MSNNKSNSISIILQKGSMPPRHYWFYPNTIKKILLSLSFVFTLVSSVAVGLSLFYAGDYFSFLSTKETLDNKISTLELEIKDQQMKWDLERKELEDIALDKSSRGLGNLQLIKTLPGKTDLTEKTFVEVDNIKLTKSNKNLEVKFHLSNQSEESRISGRLFTIFKHSNNLRIYPAPKNLNNIKFNEGEFFSIARFRKSLIPFKEINLNKTQLSESAVNIIIFSLEGDLIFDKHILVKDILGQE